MPDDRMPDDRESGDQEPAREPDELDGVVEPAALDWLRSLEEMIPEKPWMKELALRERERLTVRARAGDGLRDRHRDRLRRGGSPTITVRLTRKICTRSSAGPPTSGRNRACWRGI